MEKRERAIQLGKEITEAREKLATLERELDVLLGTPVNAQEAAQRIGLLPLSRAGSLATRVVQLLNSRPGQALGTKEIFEGIGALETEQNSVLAALSRLTSEGQIERVDRGVYAAKGTYPR